MSYVYLQHHGIKGQKWGVRRFQNADGSYTAAGKKRYNDDGSKKSSKTRRLEKNSSKIQSNIDSFKPIRNGLKDKNGRQILTKEDVKNSVDGLKSRKKIVDTKLQESKNIDSYRQQRKDMYKTRSIGSKLVTNVLAGPFANRTYNSVIASGGSKEAAIGVTAVAAVIGGPTGLGHLAVSALYTNDAGKKK